MTSRLDYYLGVSYRRKRVDSDLASLAHHFRGRVLDVGGARRRGRFRPPPDARWVVVDLAGACDVRADIVALPFRAGAFDAVKATEVLEHVPDPAAALRECARVLHAGGHLVMTAPFLERLHGDPGDYARFTETMWARLLAEAGLRPVRIAPRGGTSPTSPGSCAFSSCGLRPGCATSGTACSRSSTCWPGSIRRRACSARSSRRSSAATSSWRRDDAAAICTPHCGVSPETTSGGETYERELLTRLGRDGVRLEIILARGKPHPAGVPNWTVHRFGIGRGLRWWVAPFVVPPAIHRVYATTGFDLLRVHSLRFIGPAALWARRRWRLDVPVVAHHHHLDPDPLNRLIEKRVVDAVRPRGGRQRVRPSAARRGSRLPRRPRGGRAVRRRRAVRATPGAARSRARYGLDDGPVVLFFGGLKPRKNLPILLDVWARRPGRRTGRALVVAGGGPLRELAAPPGARRLGLGDRVMFTGYVPEAEKVDHFNLADVFVFPSAMEGFGLAVGEAMSCGLPVVASDRGSIPELVGDGESGLPGRSGAPERVRRAPGRAAADAGLRQSSAAPSRARVEAHFRWDRCVAATAAVYEATLAAWAPAGGAAR